MSKKFLNTGDGTLHFGSPAHNVRLNLHPGVNQVDEAAMSKFSHLFPNYPELQEVSELHDTVQKAPAPKLEKLVEMHDSVPMKDHEIVIDVPGGPIVIDVPSAEVESKSSAKRKAAKSQKK
jgi:hypothetical protein